MTSQRGRPDPDEEWERWVCWLGEEAAAPSIWNDILAMLAARQIWDGYRIVYNSAPTPTRSNATFQSWVTEQYVARQAMAILRQVDIDRDVIYLARLLQEIARSMTFPLACPPKQRTRDPHAGGTLPAGRHRYPSA
jgi:hypothetical protein